MNKKKSIVGAGLVWLQLGLFLLIVGGASSVCALMDSDDFLDNKKWTGDYDAMAERRGIRVLIPYSKTFYFLDGGKERGLAYESVKSFEKFLNASQKTKHLKIHVVLIPTDRSILLSHLTEGLGDIAIGNLTITEERRKTVDFSDPFLTNVKEIVVTGKKGPELKNTFDLAGKEIYVRKSSSYYESLVKLNEVLSATGKSPVKITPADEQLEDEDLLAMLDAGVVPMLIVDNHKAEFWAKILKNIRLHPDVAVHTEGKIGWAFRKNSPKLKTVIDAFVKKNKKGTLHGNMLFDRYLKNVTYVTNSTASKDRKRFKQTVKYFKKYGEKYDFDYLMLTALAYQESGLNNKAKSHVGAVGVMQILPSTAKDKNVNISNIQEVEANIHAGTKYLRFMTDRYFNDEGIDKLNRSLLAFASYNAGPAKIAKLRKEAREKGLNPNIWFNNVEVVAAKRIGRETVQYVSNIYKYFVVYSLLEKKGKL
ncbi:MAG: lytic transglycosylase F [Thermodesulfobacteriota bacterium]|nr:lytic transglycosylase F [Thermodesulfobacteriota bacterium]